MCPAVTLRMKLKCFSNIWFSKVRLVEHIQGVLISQGSTVLLQELHNTVPSKVGEAEIWFLIICMQQMCTFPFPSIIPVLYFQDHKDFANVKKHKNCKSKGEEIFLSNVHTKFEEQWSVHTKKECKKWLEELKLFAISVIVQLMFCKITTTNYDWIAKTTPLTLQDV